MKRIRLAVIFLLAVSLVIVSMPSVAQDLRIGALNDRIDQLTRKLSDLERHVYHGDSPPPAGESPTPAHAASTQVRLQELSDEFRHLTGSVEKLSHDVRILNDRVEKLVADVDFRLSAIERARAASAQAPAQTADPNAIPVVSVPGPDAARASVEPQAPPLAVGAPRDQYDHAFQLLSQRKWHEAETALQRFIDEYPEHILVSNAYYWLGETHYVRKDYERSAVMFAEGYKKFPKGNKAPDILLKLGMSLVSLGQSEDACLTFDELGKMFPDVPSTFRQQAAKAKQHAGCA